MVKFLGSLFLIFLFLTQTGSTYARTNSFVTVVNPVRGQDFWEEKGQTPLTSVKGQLQILESLSIPATWLVRFDVLRDGQAVDSLRDESFEKGLFLEVTASWADESKVAYNNFVVESSAYRQSLSWHKAGSAFLTGYSPKEREKLIDTAFEKFKQTFGYYPTSVGAWWVDSYSLEYMQQKYGILAALIVADQYSTDGYQIWGQYWSTPYYPSKRNALMPAQSQEMKIPVVVTQWAARDPVNAYGKGVEESTYSVQPNDYMDYHNLDINYFSSLIDLYTTSNLNRFGQITVGLENSYSWEKYRDEYKKQMQVLAGKRGNRQISIVTMNQFANWYKQSFSGVSPEHVIRADDPLISEKKAVWFMNPYYRVGWFYDSEGSSIKDIRQYVEGGEEICYQKACDELNFALLATRVLDDVTFGHKWLIDPGKISNLNVQKNKESYAISYRNEAGKERKIVLLPRDIAIDEDFYSIDAAILKATSENQPLVKKSTTYPQSGIGFDALVNSSLLISFFNFALFLILFALVPGLLTVKKFSPEGMAFGQSLFLALILGLVGLTLIFYLASYLQMAWLIYLYGVLALFLGIRERLLTKINLKKISFGKTNLIISLVILAGVSFQSLPTIKSSISGDIGVGLWGPNTHDGVWHLALINQLMEKAPPENPILAGTALKNYHYFYDLTVAVTALVGKLAVEDLLFRLYPLLFSLLLGIGTYYLVKNILGEMAEEKIQLSAIFALIFVYFAGSFGWVVEYLRERHWGGESAFWANQAISFNLNPPFAISLLIVIAFLIVLSVYFSTRQKVALLLLVLLGGSLVGFKAYGAILVVATLVPISIIRWLKDRTYDLSLTTLGILILGGAIFFSNYQSSESLVGISSGLFIFSPFWFIHSMIDSPDRVGWIRISLARTMGLATNNWFKFISAEVISLLIFIVGNLGTRVIGLVYGLAKFKLSMERDIFKFIILLTALSLIIPIFFIQAGNPWNTIQFFYYGLFIIALFAGVGLTEIYLSLPKVLSIPAVAFILLLTPINSMVTASGYLTNQPHALVSHKEAEALSFLSLQPPGTVLSYPFDKNLRKSFTEPLPLFAYDSTAYVSALTKKASFVADEPQNEILQTDFKKRLVGVRDFFRNARGGDRMEERHQEAKDFLSDNNIRYIYLIKEVNPLISTENQLSLRKIFENEETIIYERID